MLTKISVFFNYYLSLILQNLLVSLAVIRLISDVRFQVFQISKLYLRFKVFGSSVEAFMKVFCSGTHSLVCQKSNH